MTSRFVRHKRPILKEDVKTVEPVRLRWLLNPRGGFLEDMHRRPSSETSGSFSTMLSICKSCTTTADLAAHTKRPLWEADGEVGLTEL